MNRLFTRIILAMLLVSVASLVIVPLTQSITLRRASGNFAQDVRDLVNDRTRPPPLFGPDNRRDSNNSSNRNNSPTPKGDNGTFRPPPPRPDGERRPPPPLGSGPVPAILPVSLTNEQQIDLLFEYFSSYRTAQRGGVIIGVSLAFLGCILLSLWLARSLAKPLEAVSNAASELSLGHFDTRVKLAHAAIQPQETQALATNFNSMAEALQSSQEERKAMIADIAHELRNPIASIQFRLDALSDGLIDFSNDEADLLKSQVGLLSRLIDDLRTLSLADAGQLSLAFETISLKRLLEAVLETYEKRAQSHNITLELSYSATPSVQGDAQRLTQVINNLLDNAFKAMTNGGEVKLELSETPTEAIIRIFDTGPGLPEAQLDKLFDRFVKGERRDTKSKESSGLGLAIVKTLVSLHGGQISAQNHDHGAVFEIRLTRA